MAATGDWNKRGTRILSLTSRSASLGFALWMCAMLTACEDTTNSAGADGGSVDAGEADVVQVRNPRTCSVARLSAGPKHTCSVLTDGRIYCWGDNAEGQLGVGDVDARTTPVFVTTPAPAVEVSAGEGATCARLSNGQVACWGRPFAAPAGSPPVVRPMVVPLPGNATGVVTGGQHACVVLADARVLCWGAAGLVGDGTAAAHAAPVVLQDVPGNIVSLFATAARTCARTATGEAWCWGRDILGTGGVALGPNFGSAAVQIVGFGEPLATLALGPTSTCGLTFGKPKDETGPARPFGEVTCLPTIDMPLRTSWGGDNRSLAVGQDHVCVVHASGSVRCAGANSEGQSGPSPATSIPEAEPQQVLTDAISVRAGRAHTCALRTDGAVWCWGRNLEGQLGNGTLTTTNLPTPVAFPPGCPLP